VYITRYDITHTVDMMSLIAAYSQDTFEKELEMVDSTMLQFWNW